MIRISQIKLDYRHDTEALPEKICTILKIKRDDLISWRIVRQSLDARKDKSGTHQIRRIYSVDVRVASEKKCMSRVRDKNVSIVSEKKYVFRADGTRTLRHRPVITGTGPAGLFCGLMLARSGYRPVLIERGSDVVQRTKKVARFWESGGLDPDCNVQFGEGGAGTFSDGKLNTLVKDKTGKNRAVLEIFAKAGAGDEILYVNKPHIGTDVLVSVVKNIRNEIIALGGDVLFDTKLTGLDIENSHLKGIEVVQDGRCRYIETEILVLATGHSARDTFEMLYDRKLMMEPKAFAIGVRMEHPQTMIDMAQYGTAADTYLPPADYKLTYMTAAGRSVYTFCMCPGGHVVNASSEPGHVTVNGMSYHARDSACANSAVIVSVTPEDFGSRHPLSGVAFQRHWEHQCFLAAGGQNKIPVQLFGDFKNHRVSESFGDILPVHKGSDVFADLHQCLPDFVCDSLVEGIENFGNKIKGYNRPDAVMSGIEARTSSPLRIIRDETCQSNIRGIFPCGEGAGYAGGITSAAMDGIRVAEAVASIYHA